mgnify:CR=1 FL=1
MPTVLLYLVLAALFGAIPLLPPIALVVLLVNIREFKMNKEEKLSTALVALLAVGLLAWGVTRPKPQVEPERPVSGPVLETPQDSPAPPSSG